MRLEMSQQVKKTPQILIGEDYVAVWVESFLQERKAQNLTKGTIRYYRINLQVFLEHLNSRRLSTYLKSLLTTLETSCYCLRREDIMQEEYPNNKQLYSFYSKKLLYNFPKKSGKNLLSFLVYFSTTVPEKVFLASPSELINWFQELLVPAVVMSILSRKIPLVLPSNSKVLLARRALPSTHLNLIVHGSTGYPLPEIPIHEIWI